MIEIKKKAVSGCIMSAGPGVIRTGHVKDVHNAEIRIEAAADPFDRSARVEALRWRATRSLASYAGRDCLGRTLRVVSRSILTFRIRILPNRLVIRDGAPGRAHMSSLVRL